MALASCDRSGERERRGSSGETERASLPATPPSAAELARARALEAQGLAELAERRQRAAIELLRQAFEIDPSNPQVAERLLECLVAENELEDAAAVGRRAEVALAAGGADSRGRAKIAFLQALALERLGRASEAEPVVRRSLAHFAQNVASRFLLGRVLAAESRHREAVVELRAALAMLERASMRAGRSDIEYQLARSLQALGERDEADALFAAHREGRERELRIRRLAREVEERPASVDSHAALARELYAQGETEMARASWEEVRRIDATRLDAAAAIAVCLAQVADCERARNFAGEIVSKVEGASAPGEGAAESDPAGAVGLARLALGLCALKTGDRNAARSHLEAALGAVESVDEVFRPQIRELAASAAPR